MFTKDVHQAVKKIKIPQTEHYISIIPFDVKLDGINVSPGSGNNGYTGLFFFGEVLDHPAVNKLMLLLQHFSRKEN
jgi:hypothetical protein